MKRAAIVKQAPRRGYAGGGRGGYAGGVFASPVPDSLRCRLRRVAWLLFRSFAGALFVATRQISEQIEYQHDRRYHRNDERQKNI